MSDDKNTINIKWPDLFKPIEGLKTLALNEIVIEREVIPIIFVPGIMGSRLQRKADGAKAWDPDDSLFMLRKFGWVRVTAGERKSVLVGDPGALFNSDFLEVRDMDFKHNEKYFGKFPHAWARGWGGVYWETYGGLLTELQGREWSEPVRHCFELPVHAYGYNWTDDIAATGADLKKYIDEVIGGYSKGNASFSQEPRKCEKVILVTHSMGGLVARAACKMFGAEDNVLGVVHGVQPAMGSPAAYWRMKGGFERPEDGGFGKAAYWLRSPLKMAWQKLLPVEEWKGYAAAWTLGTDGQEVTALLGNMPGGLELLPNQFYKDNAQNTDWLEYPDLDGTPVKLPRTDPFKDIYLAEKVFYRLVNPDLLDPDFNASTSFSLPAWDRYVLYLSMANSFHATLADQLHPESYQFSSERLPSPDRINYSREIYGFGSEGRRKLKLAKDEVIDMFKSKGKDFARDSLLALIPGVGPLVGAAKLGLDAKDVLELPAKVLVKDSDWFVNRGGYRAYVDVNDDVIDRKRNNPTELIWIMTLQRTKLEYPKGSGDQTVPDSSATALKAKVSVVIGDEQEVPPSVREHQAVFGTRTARSITVAAVEDHCLKRIKDVAGEG